MSKVLSLVLVFLCFIPAAYAMPCDTGYHCVSKSGRYDISLQRCRYVNDLHLLSVSVHKSIISAATLGPAWDGKSVGDGLLAFQINLPTTDDSVRVLSVEIPAKTSKGMIKEKYAATEPEPFKVQFSESMTCKVTE